ncbi:MAG: hypothetical protein LBQ74_09775 [Prevotella sp.]|jgi:hypothetical protein|nr:hypothetical protein [Prevotella sp.]
MNNKQTIPIPAGCKAIIHPDEHIIIIEKNEFIPKKGNILLSSENWILIFDREGKNKACLVFACYNPNDEQLYYGCTDSHCGYIKDIERPATTEEQQLLFDVLAKRGKKWNPDTLQLEDIRPDLTSFEGCCTYLGIKPTLPDVSNLPVKHAKATVSNYKLWVIAEAWNKKDGFIPDYDNPKQIKHYPYFYKAPSGFAFEGSYCDTTIAGAGSGSRLAFKTSARSREFGEMFIDLHNDVLL